MHAGDDVGEFDLGGEQAAAPNERAPLRALVAQRGELGPQRDGLLPRQLGAAAFERRAGRVAERYAGEGEPLREREQVVESFMRLFSSPSETIAWNFSATTVSRGYARSVGVGMPSSDG